MEKKIFIAPYLKVVEVKTDILTASTGTGAYTDKTFSDENLVGAPHRGMWDEDFTEEDILY